MGYYLFFKFSDGTFAPLRTEPYKTQSEARSALKILTITGSDVNYIMVNKTKGRFITIEGKDITDKIDKGCMTPYAFNKLMEK
jgi:hypothetical protein